MNKPDSHQIIDLVVIAVANLMNLIMVPIFLMRTLNIEDPQILGLVWVAILLVLVTAGAMNIRAKRAWWFVIFPLLLAIFLIIEVVLDYILQYDFRNTSLLGPYLLLYYASILGMIGYSFAVQKKYGFITLATYFLSQIAAFYSYFKVGHG